MSPATSKQVAYILDLASQCGFSGDRGYNAAQELLGDGRRWKDTSVRASQLIDALIKKIETSQAQA